MLKWSLLGVVIGRWAMLLKGWKILGAVAIASVVMLAVIWSMAGWTEATVRLAIRATARLSCLLFLMAFVAPALARLWKTDFSQWLRQNRRFLGLSMAVSHGFHALTIGALHIVTQGQHPQINPLAVLGYVFLAAMVVTSFQPMAKAIGRRAWRVLHMAGMPYFWLAFMMEFAFRAMTMLIRLWPQPAIPNSRIMQ